MSATANIKAGRAYVEVTADSWKLRKSLGEAQSQLRAFSQSCSSVGRELLALGGAMSLPFVLAEEILKVAAALREKHPEEYEKRERIGMLESVAGDFIESERR